MSTIEYIPDAPRTHFTYYTLTPEAVLQLREFSQGNRDLATGDELKCLFERKLCHPSGHFKIDRLEAQSLVKAAYAEGWHAKYKYKG